MASVEVYEMGAASVSGEIRKFPVLAKQVLTTGSTTATSSAFNRSTTRISAISTDAWRGVIAATPTSTGAHFYVPAETYFDAEVIAGHKIIALSSTTT